MGVLFHPQIKTSMRVVEKGVRARTIKCISRHSAGKVMATFSSTGVVYSALIFCSNVEYYKKGLSEVRLAYCYKRQDLSATDLILFHDNSCPHTSALACQRFNDDAGVEACERNWLQT